MSVHLYVVLVFPLLYMCSCLARVLVSGGSQRYKDIIIIIVLFFVQVSPPLEGFTLRRFSNLSIVRCFLLCCMFVISLHICEYLAQQLNTIFRPWAPELNVPAPVPFKQVGDVLECIWDVLCFELAFGNI